MKKIAAIIIVNWNGKHHLRRCFEAIKKQTYQDFKVFFVDNGSVDGSVDFVKKNYPYFEIVALNKNTGFTGGNNVALERIIKKKEYSYVVFLNNDTKVDSRWLEELVKAVESDNKIGMAGSKSLFPNGKIQTIGLSIQKSHNDNRLGGASIGYGEDGNKFNNRIEIFAPCGVSAIYKTDVLRDVGFFDEDFFAYGEDIDLGFRARLRGWKAVYVPTSKLIHYHSQTSGKASNFKAYYTRRNYFFRAFKNLSLKDLFLFPFYEMKWIVVNIFGSKNESVRIVKKREGFIGLLNLYLKIIFDSLRLMPRFFKKRRVIQKRKKISSDEYNNLFKKFSRDTIESNSS